MHLLAASEADLPTVARAVLEFGGGLRTFAFTGDLGVGKTALIKAMCAQLEVGDDTASPTFAIVNEYQCADGTPVAHMDLYRIKNKEEMIDAGLLEYFDDRTYCFVEWSEKFTDLLPLDRVSVNITVNDEERRIDLSK